MSDDDRVYQKHLFVKDHMWQHVEKNNRDIHDKFCQGEEQPLFKIFCGRKKPKNRDAYRY
jgi:hypothetical protein